MQTEKEKNVKSSFWKKFKEFNKLTLADIFLPGYFFNKWIFRVGIGLIFLWLLVAGQTLGFKWENQVYIHCPKDKVKCENPFYNPFVENPVCLKYNICQKEFMMPGETYGSPSSFFVTFAEDFALFMVVIMVLLNHTLFNREYSFRKER